MSNWEKTMKEWDDSIPDGIKYLSAEKRVLTRKVRELESENDALQARIAELEAQQRWILITTKESLPKEEGSYLGYIKYPGGEYFQEEVEYSNKYGWMLDECIDITHWMPPPESPIDQLTAHNATERKDDKECEVRGLYARSND